MIQLCPQRERQTYYKVMQKTDREGKQIQEKNSQHDLSGALYKPADVICADVITACFCSLCLLAPNRQRTDSRGVCCS